MDTLAPTPPPGSVADAAADGDPSVAGVPTIQLDARSLRALAHPLRLRLLGLLRLEGPSTATALAARVGESSGTTSYHLRQLAAHGFVVDHESPSRRERWWRAAHRSTLLEPLPGADAETELLVGEYLRAVAEFHVDRVRAFAAGRSAIDDQLGGRWPEASDLSDWWLELTADEAVELRDELHAIVARRRAYDPEAPRVPGAERVVVQLQVMPAPVPTGEPQVGVL